MIDQLKAEVEDSEVSIGEAFHKLDLDGDGILSHAELLQALESINMEKRPDAKAFQRLLDVIDTDHDGQISVKDFRRMMKKMSTTDDDEYDDDEDSTHSAAFQPR